MKSKCICIAILLLFLPATVIADTTDTDKADSSEEKEDKLELSEKQQELYDELQKWYDKSKDMGEKSKAWIKDDIENIGDWEYQIITLDAEDEDTIIEQLNDLGKGRWEVFWVQEKMESMRFYLKRPVRTYMKHIPVGDMLKMWPQSQGE